MTKLIAKPKQTYALVVGIEKYAYKRFDINTGGPVNNALQFAQWLSAQGVPLENIQLCLSPLQKNEQLVKDCQFDIELAERQDVIDAIDELSTKSGDLLYVFWVGHGLLTVGRERRLICADATREDLYSIDVNSLLVLLASTKFQIRDQICLIDACANYDPQSLMDSEKFDHGDPVAENRQFVLFSSREGQTAKVNADAGTCFFSQFVLDLLVEEPHFPEDMGTFAEKVIQKFDDLDIDQLPTYFERRSFDGKRKLYDFQNIDWREVSREKLLQRQKLTTNLLTSEVRQVKDVYVPLGLVERKKQPQRQGDVLPEKGSEIYKETEITTKFEHDEFLKVVLRNSTSPKSGGKRIAIIGEPGAGKTTLLQTIADWVYREIDQAIVIWVSLADLQGQEVEQYLFNTWLTSVARKKGRAKTTKELQDDFATQFSQGLVWLLLDGLDEMSTGNPLTEIARQIRSGGAISQARIVLTCRVNLWDDSSGNALNDFDTYRTLNFSYPDQVEDFINRWFSVKSGGAIAEGQRLCTALKEPGKERIQDLVKNPLRLTLLCLTWDKWQQYGGLPDTTAGLYKSFVDYFYKYKFPIKQQLQESLNQSLGELSQWAINQPASRFRIRLDQVPPDIKRKLGYTDDINTPLGLAIKLGWLNNVGIAAETPDVNVYSFFHASFQEYFAAQGINDWHYFLKHIPKNPSQGTYRIFEPQWRQTILLWLGRKDLAKEQKQAFIEALIQFDDGCGKWSGKEQVDKGFYEYRAYFLAAAGLSEFRDFSQADEIIAQIIKLGFGYFRTIKKGWVKFLDPIANEALATLEKTQRKKAIAALVQLLNLTDVYKFTDKRAAEILEKIGAGNKQVIAALVQLLNSTGVDNDARRQAAESLGKIDPGNKQVIAALVQLLNLTDVDNDARRRVAESLGKIDPGNKQAIAALVQLLNSTDVSHYARWWAARSLGEIGAGNKQAIAALVQLLNSTDVDNDTRTQVARSLGEIGAGNKQAIAALVQLLNLTDVDNDARRQAAESLGKIDPGNKQAIAALVQLLNLTDVDNDTRSWVAISLGEIDPGNEQAIAALVQLLNSTDVDNDTRSWVAISLGKIDPGNKQAIAALVQLLNSTDVSHYARTQVAISLGEIGAGNEQAIAALVQLLNSTDVSHYARWWAADSLEKILQEGQFTDVVKALKNHLYKSNKFESCYRVIWYCIQNMPYPEFYQAWHHHTLWWRRVKLIKIIRDPWKKICN